MFNTNWTVKLSKTLWQEFAPITRVGAVRMPITGNWATSCRISQGESA